MRIVFLLMIFFVCSKGLFAQVDDDSKSCLRLNAVSKGIRFENKKYFKKFGLLLQDTCSYFNRVSRSFYSTGSDKALFDQYYNAIIIDSALASYVEEHLSGDPVFEQNEGVVKRLNNPNRSLCKFIRLYIGFTDQANDTCIVIQYLTRKEFKRSRFYDKQMDLIAQKGRNLRFLILKKEPEGVVIANYFPSTLLK